MHIDGKVQISIEDFESLKIEVDRTVRKEDEA